MRGENSNILKKNDNDKIESLVALAKKNDKLSFIELVGIFSPYIFSLARNFNVSESEYDDLCEEGRIALFRAIGSYDSDKSSFITYARICIKNAMLSFLRKFSSKSKYNHFNISIDEIENEGHQITDDSTPESNLMASEFLSELEKVIENVLSDAEKEVIKHKLSGIGTQEISVLIGKSTKSVENTLFRARKKLKLHLDTH